MSFDLERTPGARIARRCKRSWPRMSLNFSLRHELNVPASVVCFLSVNFREDQVSALTVETGYNETEKSCGG
jgi:hypothetical protein